MQNSIIRRPDGKFKRWFKNTVIGSCCAVIVGVSIGGICMSATHPWSEIVKTTFTPPKSWDGEFDFIQQTENLNFDININIVNHNGDKFKNSLRNQDFKVGNPQHYGHIAWSLDTDFETRAILRYCSIDQDTGSIFIDIKKTESTENIKNFNLYIKAIVYFDNPIFPNTLLTLVSNPMPLVLKDEPDNYYE